MEIVTQVRNSIQETMDLPQEVGHMDFHLHPTLLYPLDFYQAELTKPVRKPKALL